MSTIRSTDLELSRMVGISLILPKDCCSSHSSVNSAIWERISSSLRSHSRCCQDGDIFRSFFVDSKPWRMRHGRACVPFDVVCKADRQYGPDESQLILTDIFYSINDFVPDRRDWRKLDPRRVARQELGTPREESSP